MQDAAIRIAELEQELAKKIEQIEQQRQRIEQQCQQIEQLKEVVAQLRERLDRNSGNSSLPPSSDSPEPDFDKIYSHGST